MTLDELGQLSKDELIALVLKLAKRIAQLESERDDHKEPQAKRAASWMKASVPEPEEKQPRKQRPHGFARKREEPTHRVQHAAATCPHCQCSLTGGWVRRRRQVLHIPLAPVQVIDHEVIARQCPQCGREVVPDVDLSAEVVDQHRVSVQTMSVIATLREVGRLPVRTIQWYLDTLHGLKLSVGELVEILHTVAKLGKATLERLLEQVRAGPVVNADETGWCENGRNGYVWTFTTPEVRYFLYRHSRSGAVVTEALGEEFTGHLVTDFYGGYNRMLGPHQRCWVHLLRDIHKLKEEYPDNVVLHRWARQVHRIYRWAKGFRSEDNERRLRARYLFERLLSRVCQPFRQGQVPQRILCQRIERFLSELFAFVADPRVPSDNNAAERSLRPLVVSRKISGGTRAPQGSETKMSLASLFGTWQVCGENPFRSCQKLLLSPQV